MTYTYLRTGNGHVHGPYEGLTERQARQIVGVSLYANGTAKADAVRVARQLAEEMSGKPQEWWETGLDR